jgi:hypothetical protein
MDTVDTDLEPSSRQGASLLRRLQPRLSARTQLLLAGTVWYAAAIALGMRGVGWLVPAEWGLLLAGVGVALGLLKARYAMSRVAARAIARIRERDRNRCAGGFFSWQSWVVVLAMMAVGHALRLTSLPRPALGVLYVAISTGLLVAGALYWRAAYTPSEDVAPGS